MNERPAPETDAELNLYFRHGEAQQISIPWIEFARKLERERDEAKEYSKATRKSLRDSQDEVLRLTFENREISQELDEARDTIMKIEEIFIDSEDIHDDWMKVGNIARTYLEK